MSLKSSKFVQKSSPELPTSLSSLSEKREEVFTFYQFREEISGKTDIATKPTAFKSKRKAKVRKLKVGGLPGARIVSSENRRQKERKNFPWLRSFPPKSRQQVGRKDETLTNFHPSLSREKFVREKWHALVRESKTKEALYSVAKEIWKQRSGGKTDVNLLDRVTMMNLIHM